MVQKDSTVLSKLEIGKWWLYRGCRLDIIRRISFRHFQSLTIRSSSFLIRVFTIRMDNLVKEIFVSLCIYSGCFKLWAYVETTVEAHCEERVKLTDLMS
jgi:hypothetical protein